VANLSEQTFYNRNSNFWVFSAKHLFASESDIELIGSWIPISIKQISKFLNLAWAALDPWILGSLAPCFHVHFTPTLALWKKQARTEQPKWPDVRSYIPKHFVGKRGASETQKEQNVSGVFSANTEGIAGICVWKDALKPFWALWHKDAKLELCCRCVEDVALRSSLWYVSCCGRCHIVLHVSSSTFTTLW